MDDEEDPRFSVVDVYDIAADIGKEFEKIIDQYGPDVLTSLMPRVITALEQLERVAEKQEASGTVIEELRSTISVLETQKIGQAEHKLRYARDLEDVERDMREEKQELSAKVTQLLDENRKLSTCIARSTDNTPSLTDEESSLEPEVQASVVSRLQDALETQRNQMMALQEQMHSMGHENDQLTGQVERVTQGNKDMRRRYKQATQQIRQLVEERAELHVSLQEQQRAVDQLHQRLGLAAKENYDLATAQVEPSDLSSKLVFDRGDPNRPRFTLIELKDILYQRNELKARLSDLEDELALYRPKGNKNNQQQEPQQQSHIICPPEEANGPPLVDIDKLTLGGPDSLGKQLQDASTSPPPSPLDGEPPVQGPMPYEPDDAPWKRRNRESGIRKFFSRMKKLSDVVLGGNEAVLGTPTTTPPNTTTSNTTTHLPLPPYYHSTPNSAFSTPTPSLIPQRLNNSSPSSLRSLPSKLSTAEKTKISSAAHSSKNCHKGNLKFSDFPSNNSSLLRNDSGEESNGSSFVFVDDKTPVSFNSISSVSYSTIRQPSATTESSSEVNSVKPKYNNSVSSSSTYTKPYYTPQPSQNISTAEGGASSSFTFEKFRQHFGLEGRKSSDHPPHITSHASNVAGKHSLSDDIAGKRPLKSNIVDKQNDLTSNSVGDQLLSSQYSQSSSTSSESKRRHKKSDVTHAASLMM